MNIERTIKKTGFASLVTGLLISCTIDSSLAQRKFPNPSMQYVDAQLGATKGKLQDLIRKLEPMGKDPSITRQQALEITAQLKAVNDELGKIRIVVMQHESEETKAKHDIIIGELTKDHRHE